ncbi:MAG: dTMP kinase [Pseudomonadota bacterium]|nr:dTMP kinase [Pseudomonadota bacterium]
MFITIEGLDGSGGTTQVERLRAEWARRAPGREVVCTREPSPGPVGRLLRQALADVTIGEGVLPYLFAADRRDHLDRVVLPALARGAVVISDRYALSSLAYQSAALGLDKVAALNADFPAPDLTVLLDLPPAECLARIDARGATRERFETLPRLEQIAAAYEAGLLRLPTWRVARIDASGTPDEVAARVAEAVGQAGGGTWPR